MAESQVKHVVTHADRRLLRQQAAEVARKKRLETLVPSVHIDRNRITLMRLRFMVPPVSEPVRHPHDTRPDPVQPEIALNRFRPQVRVMGVRPTKRGSRVAGQALRPVSLGVTTGLILSFPLRGGSVVTGGKRCRD